MSSGEPSLLDFLEIPAPYWSPERLELLARQVNDAEIWTTQGSSESLRNHVSRWIYLEICWHQGHWPETMAPYSPKESLPAQRLMGPPHRQTPWQSFPLAWNRGARIPWPEGPQQLWAQWKYTVMARSQSLYRSWGPALASKPGVDIDSAMMFEVFVPLLRAQPSVGNLTNVAQHLWGYWPERPKHKGENPMTWDQQILQLWASTREGRFPYLIHSLALTELVTWK